MKSLFNYFVYFEYLVGKKIYLLVIIAFTTTLMEGLGISIVLPLLSLDNLNNLTDDSVITTYLAKLFSYLVITPSFISIITLIIVVFLLKFILQSLFDVLNSYIFADLEKKYKIYHVQSCNKMTYSYYTKSKPGYYNNLVTTVPGQIISAFKKYVATIIMILNIIIFTTFSLIINYKLTFILIVLGILIFLSHTRLRKSITKMSYKSIILNGEIQDIFLQFFSNYKYLKSTNTSKKVLKHLYPLLTKSKSLNFIIQSVISVTSSLFQFLNVLIVVLVITYLYLEQGQSIIMMIVPIALINRSFGSILSLQSEWQTFLSRSGSIAISKEAISNIKQNSETTNDLKLNKFKDQINFIDVSYKIDDNIIFSNINLTIKKNDCVGIVGPSGCGKTTLVDLIIGLILPSKGTIQIDDIPYSIINISDLRSKISYVTQDPCIFGDSIINNITMWDNEVDSDKISNAINYSQLSYINNNPDKFDQIIASGGSTLSGGQKQRISIARELYRDTSIIIFDEATSSLDYRTKNRIKEMINTFIGNKTILIISHVIDDLNICNKIIEIDNGKINTITT
tara:strand:+ start:8763 stop:10463 length:1701 start_codon:yes stop_codon:yes gene_type:complete